MLKKTLLWAVLLIGVLTEGRAQQKTVARQWNEALLEAIREDFARPTVHARNLFHVSAAMYDAWAAYNEYADTYFLGKTVHGFTIPFEPNLLPAGTQADQEKAISYAAFRLLNHRFANSPGALTTLARFESLMDFLGYDPEVTTIDYTSGPAGLGNYIAEFVINYGLQDGSNESDSYLNQVYEPVNEFLAPAEPGNPNMTDPNRWQPLALDVFIDQSGNVTSNNTPEFLSPEWGQVSPFSLKEEDKTTFERDGFEYQVYHDPGPPPFLDPENGGGLSDEYKWGFALVSVWSSHLNDTFEEMIDISPASIGNLDIDNFPTDWESFRDFYDLLEGGDPSPGRSVNPVTGAAYIPQMVPRSDYGRVLAEFWADGPDSETPPGHWFTILNYVNDHSALEKKFKGRGQIVGDLQWDVMSYLVLGGAMHDVAIAAWGIKGRYDYVRPISAIRYMADQGQSSDENLPNYNVAGIPLIDGYIELVGEEDPLVGENNEHLNKIKLLAWKGPDFIEDPETDQAGVGWILAENWWPYQRPSFVTPPFAGYVSGHSTYSRAAAEALTLFTGTPYFPGGLGEFVAPRNEFLVFEEGPSQDIILQWATYRDASDQCSLSRIWGGIHPPADDIPGRIIGETIGVEAFEFAEELFGDDPILGTEEDVSAKVNVYPNPVESNELIIKLGGNINPRQLQLLDNSGKRYISKEFPQGQINDEIRLDLSGLTPGFYIVNVLGNNWRAVKKVIVQK